MSVTRTSEDNNFRTRSAYVQEEFEECAHFLQDSGVRGMYVFFGSARTRSQAQIDATCRSVDAELQSKGLTHARRKQLEDQKAAAQRKQWAVPLWEATCELSRLLTEWSLSEQGRSVGNKVWSLLPGGHEKQPLMVCSGGGPGFMEAANKGARLAGGASIGLGVKLPFEAQLNEYVDFGMTAHSFYVRKYWEVYAIKAMVVCPGGMGTLDEMFEVLTLIQCGHCPKIPIVLLGKEFFQNTINFQYLAKCDMISQYEVDALCITDDPVEAFTFITDALKAEVEARRMSSPTSPQKLVASPSRLQGNVAGSPSSHLISSTGRRPREVENCTDAPPPPAPML